MLFIVANDVVGVFFLERASESISQLKYALAKGENGTGFDQSSVDEGSDSADRDNDDCGNAASQELQHSHAGKITLKANGLNIFRNYTNFNEKVIYLLVIMVFISS